MKIIVPPREINTLCVLAMTESNARIWPVKLFRWLLLLSVLRRWYVGVGGGGGAWGSYSVCNAVLGQNFY